MVPAVPGGEKVSTPIEISKSTMEGITVQSHARTTISSR